MFKSLFTIMSLTEISTVIFIIMGCSDNKGTDAEISENCPHAGTLDKKPCAKRNPLRIEHSLAGGNHKLKKHIKCVRVHSMLKVLFKMFREI